MFGTDSFGWYIPQEGKTLHGTIPGDHGLGDHGDVYGDTFSLYFDDGDCIMWVGQDYALLTWERTKDGALLKGDSEYPITFPDNSETGLVVVTTTSTP